MPVYIRDSRMQFMQDPVEMQSFGGPSLMFRGRGWVEIDISIIIEGETDGRGLWNALSERDAANFAVALWRAAKSDEIQRGEAPLEPMVAVGDPLKEAVYNGPDQPIISTFKVERMTFRDASETKRAVKRESSKRSVAERSSRESAGDAKELPVASSGRRAIRRVRPSKTARRQTPETEQSTTEETSNEGGA